MDNNYNRMRKDYKISEYTLNLICLYDMLVEAWNLLTNTLEIKYTEDVAFEVMERERDMFSNLTDNIMDYIKASIQEHRDMDDDKMLI